MEYLFSQKRIEDYFNQIIRCIKNEIDNYSEHHFATLEIESVVEQLFNRYSITVPVLLKDKTKSYITTEHLEGHQLPSGTHFIIGQKYPVDIANYSIPFSGNSELFSCIPTNFSGGITDARIGNGVLIIQLTNWGKIIGNEKILGNIKNQLLTRVDKIEEILSYQKNDVDKFLESLRPQILQYLEGKINQVKLKIDSSDKLNPFK